MQNTTRITINEIKKKLNNKKAIIDFFREQGMLIIFIYLKIGLYYPNFSSFNYYFCIQVLMGEKKVQI